MRTYGLTLHRQLEATPQGVLQRDLGQLLHGDDRRWRFPSREEIETDSMDDVRRTLEAPLTNGPIEVIVVGDITLEDVRDAVARTLGALPPRTGYPPVAPEALEVSFPSPAVVERSHTGRADQAIAYLAWPTSDFASNTQEARELRLLQLVMELRLIDRIRIAQGATYSPNTDWAASTVFPGYGYLAANVEIPPDRIDGFFADVFQIAADLRENEVSADELERARNPRIEALQRAKQTNEYWIGQLAGAQEDSRRLDWIRSSIPGLQQVSAADIRQAAQAYLADDKAWRLVVKAE
jgi:zinc protease